MQDKRGGKILCRKARIEVAEYNLIDLLGTDTGIGQRVAGHSHNEAFNSLIAKFSEGRMGPPDNTGGHRCLLCRTLVDFFGNELQVTIYIQLRFTRFAYHPKLR